jgi:recombination protein RecT
MSNTAMVVSAADKQQNLKAYLERAKQSIEAVIPKHMDANRLLKVVLSATSRNALLLACTQESILRCVMQSAELGLEVGGLLGDAYLVPFNNKDSGKYESQLIIGYRGMVKLARQSGYLQSLEARVIHENDHANIVYGLEAKLEHRPCMKGEAGEVVGVYAIARFKDGGHQAEFLTKAEVDRIRLRSKASNEGPWVTDYEEMAKKTVVRRICKYLPLSPELARAIEHDTAIEALAAPQVIDMDVFGNGGEKAGDEAAKGPPTRADTLKEALKNDSQNSVKVTADGEVLP